MRQDSARLPLRSLQMKYWSMADLLLIFLFLSLQSVNSEVCASWKVELLKVSWNYYFFGSYIFFLQLVLEHAVYIV